MSFPKDSPDQIKQPRPVDSSGSAVESSVDFRVGKAQLNFVEICRVAGDSCPSGRRPINPDRAVITSDRVAHNQEPGASANPSGQSSVWNSLEPLRQAHDLEQHLRTYKNARGQIETSVQPEAVSADGHRTIIVHTSESLVRAIKQNYLEALRTAADSEPARQRDLAQIDQNIETLKKSMDLERTPSLHDLNSILAPANHWKLTPDQRAALEVLKGHLTLRQELLNSGTTNVQAGYELFLEKTGQRTSLEAFRRDKQLMETLPFQNWLNTAEKSLGRQINIGQLTVREDGNPFTEHQAALSSLQQNPPDRDGADRDFRRAIRLAEKIDPNQVNEELGRLKILKEKTDPNTFDYQILKQEEKTLILLKSAPGLMKVAYADYLLTLGDKDAAFQQLSSAADNPTAIALINKNNNYFEQLVDRSTYGDKTTLTQLSEAVCHIKESDDHFARALQFSKSNNPDDKVKAGREFEEAKEAAKKAREESKQLDTREIAKNVQLFEAAIKTERSKPAEKQNQEKLTVLQAQRANYVHLSHIPSLACLSQAKDEYALAVHGGNPPDAEQAAAIRALTDWVKGDNKLSDIAGASEQLNALREIVRQRSYGESALNWLRQNSGSLVALGVGFTVAGLTCWSGPGAALLGAAAAGAVAGTCADWACGNEVSLESFGGNALSAAGGGVGKLVGTKLAAGALSRSPWLLRSVTSGAVTAGSSSAIENIPMLVYEGPHPYLGKVSFDGAFGAVLHGPKSKIADHVPAVRSPIFSRSLKAGTTGFKPD